ncbi:L-aspartate oxidase [Sphingomonas sp. WKB10]|nr:L-aspartate oxidase [Sphingomonas sp. WKB10]
MSESPPATDVLIVGSGAAGLTAALNLADRFKVTVLAKGALNEGSTAWAQGGIAAVLEPGDTFDNHVEDTMVAGAGLNDRDIVEFVVENALAAIERLTQLGVPFATEGNALHLTREGGHSHRRIVHVADATGWAVQEALQRAAEAHPNITLVPDQVAIDLATSRHEQRYSGAGNVWGVYAVDRGTGRVTLYTARATVLATGGAGRTYLFSTAPRGATGDGIAMAWRAGCRVSNMEMMQFHPTCLYNLEVKNFLITEAVRGEGGRLINPTTGKRFMSYYDAERMELAPRDVVARAIDAEIKRYGLDYVHLDISHQPPEFVKGHFPNIYESCSASASMMTTQPIPVVPAQHYTCGGIVIDRDGRTDLPGLYAAGECTESGLHGANRLASNSLLECFVFGEACADHIAAHWGSCPRPRDPALGRKPRHRFGRRGGHQAELDRNPPLHVELRRHRPHHEAAGAGAARIQMLTGEVADCYGHFRVTPDLIELRNLLQTAELIVRSALHRHESRGLHYTLDYPQTAAEAVDTVLVP